MMTQKNSSIGNTQVPQKDYENYLFLEKSEHVMERTKQNKVLNGYETYIYDLFKTPKIQILKIFGKRNLTLACNLIVAFN